MTKQIFVIGKNRSGTKWLSNTIANHTEVSCIQRPGAGGILETNLFFNMPTLFGDLSIDDNYFGFLACFAKTNFFKITELDEKLLYAVRFDSYFRFFEYVMDAYAEKQSTGYWLQKAHTGLLPTLYNEFPNARFIITRRDVVDTIRSSIGLRILNETPKLKATRRIVRDVFSYHLHDKSEKRFAARPNVLMLSYEELRADKQLTIEKACSFLQIPFHSEMLVDKWPKNTSFPTGYNKDRLLSPTEIYLIKSLSHGLAFFPWPVWAMLHKIDKHLHTDLQERRFMRKTFELFREEANWPEGR